MPDRDDDELPGIILDLEISGDSADIPLDATLCAGVELNDVDNRSVIKCSGARYEAGKCCSMIVASGVDLVAGWYANRLAGQRGAHRSPRLFAEGWMRTYPLGVDTAGCRYQTHVVKPEAALTVSSVGEAQNAVSEFLTANRSGTAEAVLRISNADGGTMYRRIRCDLGGWRYLGDSGRGC